MTSANDPATRVLNTVLHAEAFEVVAKNAGISVDRVFPRSVRTTLDRYTRIGWLPIATHLDLIEAASSVLSPGEFSTALGKLGMNLLGAPLLAAVAQGGMRLSGATPTALTWWTPKGWHLVFRAMGEPSAQRIDATTATLTIERMPAVIFRSPVWVEAMRAFLESFTQFTGRACAAKTQLVVAEEGRVVFFVQDR